MARNALSQREVADATAALAALAEAESRVGAATTILQRYVTDGVKKVQALEAKLVAVRASVEKETAASKSAWEKKVQAAKKQAAKEIHALQAAHRAADDIRIQKMAALG